MLKKISILLTHTFIYLFSINAYANDNFLINKIEDTWNNTRTISGNFRQLKQDGDFIYGEFAIKKPYKSYFSYYNNFDKIITSKFFMNVVDKENFLIDRFPIINHPIYKLLSEKINIEDSFNILSIKTMENEIKLNLSIKNKKQEIGGQINLGFNKDDFLLKNWEIIDGYGKSTYLEFTKLRKNISISTELFTVLEKTN